MAAINRDHCRILVADDDSLSQQVSLGILKNAGYTVDCVSNGREAVKAMEATRYDLVLMDCLMPEMDGFEATSAIRSPQSRVVNRDAVIIALTALASEGDRQKCVEAGMDDFLSKPVNALTLIGMIDQYISTIQASGVDMARPSGTDTEPEDPATQVVAQRTSPAWSEEDLSSITSQFVKEVPGQITELREALGNNDAEGLRMLAHRIRGGASIFHSEELADRALNLEKAARRGDFETAPALADVLIRTLQELARELENDASSVVQARQSGTGPIIEH